MKFLVKQIAIVFTLVFLLLVMFPFASRTFFEIGADGWVKLSVSPFLVPKIESFNKHCSLFKDEDGKTQEGITYVGKKGVYCSGQFWYASILGEKEPFIPYKLKDNGQALYWLHPFKKVIGPAPKFARNQGQ